jgi:2-polyprenyl-6-methoxyphenol hydroxylase-like FAD-dependent oxidoreductase
LGVGSLRSALIVGGGIGGLAAGVALKRAGWTVRIFERAANLREVGFALGLAPYAVDALRNLGVADAVLAEAATPALMAAPTGGRLTAELRRSNGRVLRRLSLDLAALPQGNLPALVTRPVLHGALLQAVGGETIATESEAVAFEIEDSHVRLQLANGMSATGDVLVGADGVASVIRRQLHPQEAAPRPSGYFALRGVSPAVHLLDGRHFILYFGPGIEVGVVQASATMVYWYVSLLADEVRRGALEPEAVLRRFTADVDEQFRAIAAAAVDMRLDELFVRDPLPKWGTGPVTLLGDAAHPMLPHTGQGAAQALEDAVALGRALGSPGNRLAALRQYERERAPRAYAVVRTGPRIARLATTRNPLVGFVRNTAIRLSLLIPQPLLLRALLPGADARDRAAVAATETGSSRRGH